MHKNKNTRPIARTLGCVIALGGACAGHVQAADAFSSESQWGLGDWGGKRTEASLIRAQALRR